MSLKEMDGPSPVWWLECDVVLSHSRVNIPEQHFRDGGARRQKKTKSSSLLSCNKLKSSVLYYKHIYLSLMGLWVGWGSSVWYETLNLKQGCHECYKTMVPTTSTRGEWLPFWPHPPSKTSGPQHWSCSVFGMWVQFDSTCRILIPRLEGDWKLAEGQWHYLPNWI